MRFPIVMLLCVFSLAAAGCTAMHADQTAKQLDPLVGHRLSEVSDLFGPPTGNYDMGQGFMAFEWDHFGAGQSGTTDCLVVIAAMPTYGDVQSIPVTARDNWIVQSWHPYGKGCL
jgi:hypothetical protein